MSANDKIDYILAETEVLTDDEFRFFYNVLRELVKFKSLNPGCLNCFLKCSNYCGWYGH